MAVPTLYSTEFSSNLFDCDDLTGSWMPKSSQHQHHALPSGFEPCCSLSAVPFLADSAGIFKLCRKTLHIDHLPDRQTDRQAAVSELWVTFHSSSSKSPSVSACNCQTAAFHNLSDLETHVHLWQWWFILTYCNLWHSFTSLTSGHFTAYGRIML